MSEDRIAEINRQLDRVIAYGPDQAVSWLRAAFHSHERQVEDLREGLAELRAMLLAEIGPRPLTVREAQKCNVCRVCRGPSGASIETGAFVLNYGEEFAHEKCLADEPKA